MWGFVEQLQEVHRQSMEDEAAVLIDPAAALRLRASQVREKEEALSNLKAMYIAGQYVADIDYVKAVAKKMNDF